MKKSILFSIVAVAMLFTACNPVQPNFEGVLMQNYGRNGMADFSTVTGNQGILGAGTELYQVPMYEQTADVDPIELRSKDGGSFTVDPKYTYEAIRGKGIDIVFNYKHVGLSDPDKAMDNIEVTILSPLVLNAYRDVARKYSTDSIMNHVGVYESEVEDSLNIIFASKFFKLNTLTSGVQPPATMVEAINNRNNQRIKSEQVELELQTARNLQEKARIEQETNKIVSQGLTKEILLQQWIEAVRNSNNKIIITDGKTPVFLQQ